MAKIAGVHVPAKVKNYIINGNMDFWQRVEGNNTSVNTTVSTQNYTADKMKSFSSGTTNKNYSIIQSSSVPTLTQSGFDSQSSYQFTVGTGISSYNANDLIWPFYHILEGYDYQRLHGKTVTFGFWFQASVAGSYSFSLSNSSVTRSYVTTFSIPVANTWQYVTLTITLDSAGTWVFNSGQGLLVFIGASGGSTATTSTLNSWQTVTGANNVTIASTATNFYGTTGATFNITQFSLIEGETGLGVVGFQRAGENISEELRMCQRYCSKSYQQGVAAGTATPGGRFLYMNPGSASQGQELSPNINYPCVMRTTPTLTFYSTNSGTSGKIFAVSTSADTASATVAENNQRGFAGINIGVNYPAGNIFQGQYLADADL